MKKTEIFDRLAEIVQVDIDTIGRNAMIKVDDHYELFDQYVVAKNKDHTYSVTKHLRDARLFNSVRSAAAWCISDKLQQYETARTIAELDHQHQVIRQDVDTAQQLLSRITDWTKRDIVTAKLSHKQAQLIQLQNQLTKCVNLAKYWQIKGFIRDETARPRPVKTTR